MSDEFLFLETKKEMSFFYTSRNESPNEREIERFLFRKELTQPVLDFNCILDFRL